MSGVVWNIKALSLRMQTEEEAMDWCYEMGLLPRSMVCPLCGIDLEIKKKRQFGRFVCKKRVAGHAFFGEFNMSAAKNTFFSKCKLPVSRVIFLVYCFARKFTYQQVLIECGDPNMRSSSTTHKTISDWFCYLRGVCKESLELRYASEPFIGGANHIVEIAERKMKEVQEGNQMLVLGLVDRETKELRLELYATDVRDVHNFLYCIKKHVAAGSTIITECWREYDDLDADKFRQWSNENGLRFVQPPTPNSTNTILSSWGSLKRRLARGGVRQHDMAEHLCEYLWRRDCERLQQDPFLSLIADIGVFYPGGIVYNCNGNCDGDCDVEHQ